MYNIPRIPDIAYARSSSMCSDLSPFAVFCSFCVETDESALLKCLHDVMPAQYSSFFHFIRCLYALRVDTK